VLEHGLFKMKGLHRALWLVPTCRRVTPCINRCTAAPSASGPPSQSSTRLRRHHHAPRAARAKSTYGCSLPHAWPSADALAGSLPAIAASDAYAPRTSCATPLIRLPCIEAEPHTTPFHPRAHMRSSSPPLPLLRGTRPSSSSRPLPTTPRSSLDLTRASTTTC
jgi:hypothetical protein